MEKTIKLPEQRSYNPRNTDRWKGYIFSTRNKQRYAFGRDGKMETKRESVNGAEYELISAWTRDEFLDYSNHLMDGERDKIKSIILGNPRKPARGLHLVVLYTEESGKERPLPGFVTSPIHDISPPRKH